MTTDNAAQILESMQELIGEAEALTDSYRDASIPEGTVMGETAIGRGLEVQWTKPPSMVHAGKVPLPERFAAYDRDGMLHMLPTAQMNAMLTKSRADSPGERAFHTHSAKLGVTRESCSICPPLPSNPYQGTCEWCLERSFGRTRKVFRNESAERTHKQRYHPDEYEAHNHEMDRAERHEASAAQTAMADAILAALKGGVAVPPQNISSEPASVLATVKCEHCDWQPKEGTNQVFALAGHLRMKHGEA